MLFTNPIELPKSILIANASIILNVKNLFRNKSLSERPDGKKGKIMTISYGIAKKSECSVLAELINTASAGVLEYLMRDLVPGMTPVQLEAANLARDKYPYTYRNVRVARDDGRVVGMALSYPSSYHGITPEMRDFFPEERLAHLTDFFTSRVENSWYLDALSVQASHRRQGLGEALIAATKATATENGFDALSLIAFADNHNALALYRKTGFKVVKRVTLQKNRTIQHEGGCVLLNCALHTS